MFKLSQALFASAALFAIPALARAADDAPSVAPIVVTGHAPPEDQPLSVQSVTAADISRTTNAVTVDDALKYLPDIFVRRRHIGDTQAPMTTRTSGVGSSARSLIYVDGVLISALIGNNNSTASPRWGMAVPSEVERIDVRYGPFSAAYPGNSIGAVVEIATRTPTRFEADAGVSTQWQGFEQYGTKATYPSYAAHASLGNRIGDFAWRLSFEHLDARAQPLAYVTATRPAGSGATGTPVSGAFADVNRTGAPIFVLGAGGIERQAVDNGKLKLAWSPSPDLTASYVLGYFGNRDRAGVQSYLTTAAGQPAYSGALNIASFAVNVPTSAFSNNLYRLDERHWMQALTFEGAPTARLRWQAIASLYDYGHDQQRTPSGALPAAFSGGPGSILDLGGTGWATFDTHATWTPGEAGQALTAGYHFDQYRLGADRYATPDWLAGGKGPLAAASRGKTETQALFVEDAIPLARGLRLTLGLRGERWRAFDGFNFQASPALAVRQPVLSASRVSPKAVLAWSPDAAWSVTASAGVAYRFPTVSELYQAVTVGAQTFTSNPDLAPERALSTDLSIKRQFGWGEARLSLFTEDVHDALISQTALTPIGTTSFVQNVDLVRTRGAEAEVKAHDVFVSGLDLTGSVTWVDSTIARDPAFPAAQGKRTPQVPRLRWTAVATWQATPKLTLTAAARYADRAFGTIDNSDVVAHTYQGFDRYLVLDARALYRIDEHWSAALGIDNAGNERYFLFHPFPQRSVLAEVTYAY
jgi:iron complex outermembrane receptor protein